MTSGVDFTVPLLQVPTNIVLNALCLKAFKTSKHFSDTFDYLCKSKEPELERLTTSIDLGVFAPPPRDLRLVVASDAKIDFAGLKVPPYMELVGPVVQPCLTPLMQASPTLCLFVRGGPTVLVNLGARWRTSVKEAVEIAHALRILFEEAHKKGIQNMRLIWKLVKKPEPTRKTTKPKSSNKSDKSTAQTSMAALSAHDLARNLMATMWENPPDEWDKIDEILRPVIKKDHVKIMPWIPVQPMSILVTGHVVVNIHHGSINSFNEALW